MLLGAPKKKSLKTTHPHPKHLNYEDSSFFREVPYSIFSLLTELVQTTASQPAAMKQQIHKLQRQAPPTLSPMPKSGNS